MLTAAGWAHIRMGALTQMPKLGSIEDRARTCSFEDFIRIVQDDAAASPSAAMSWKTDTWTDVEWSALKTQADRILCVMGRVRAELESSMARFKPMNSAHEGYAVILEEMDELWDEIKVNQSKRDYAKMEKECIQVAAMVVRLLLDVVRDPKRGHEKVATPTDIDKQALYLCEGPTRPSAATLSGDQPRGPSAELPACITSEASAAAIERDHQERAEALRLELAKQTCFWCSRPGCTGFTSTGKPVHAPIPTGGGWAPGCAAAMGLPS